MLVKIYLEILEMAEQAANHPNEYKIMYHYSGAIDIIKVSEHTFRDTNYYVDITYESLQTALKIIRSELTDEICVNLKTIQL